MKLDRGLKIALIILLIILVSIISFLGLFVQEKNAMVNLVKDYELGMDLKGYRLIALAVDESDETIYYDKDGKVVEEEAEDGTKEVVPVNEKESLTKENYLKTKEIYEKRLDALYSGEMYNLGEEEYHIRLNESTGKIFIQLPENHATDFIAQFLYINGKVTIEDEEGNVLLDNSNIQEVASAYTTFQDGSTTVYLNLEFNKDSREKFREITNTYKTSTDEKGNDNSKVIVVKIDGMELDSISFPEEVTNGILSVELGTSTSSDTINSYFQSAYNFEVLLNDGALPITYTIEQNRYIKSDVEEENLIMAGLITASIVLVALVVLVVMYRKNGILVSISYVGYVAVLLLTIRYMNVILTTEGLFAILIGLVLNYVFSIYLLKTLKNAENDKVEMSKGYNSTVITMILILIPAMIISIATCFTSWLPIFSFGAVIFYAISLILIYNSLVTRTLLLLSSKKQ